MDSRRIISGFVFVFLILIGKGNLTLDQGGVCPSSQSSAGLTCKINQQSALIANAPLLLEESEDSFRVRPKYAPAQDNLLLDPHSSSNSYFWVTYQKFSALPPVVTTQAPPRYILFHALIIPS